ACRSACDEMINARPTAVNLSFEVNRCFEMMKSYLAEGKSKDELYQALVEFGKIQIKESHDKNTKMAQIGFQQLLEKFGDRKWRLMTHCNTGFLACGSLGTALGVISYANQQGKVEYVLADETRPYM